MIVRLEELADICRIDGLHGVAIARSLPAERMVGEQLRGEHAMRDVVGRVVVHRQFFEYHQSFAVDVGLTQCRTDQHVAEQLDAELGMSRRQPAVVGGVFLRREGVEITADAINRS